MITVNPIEIFSQGKPDLAVTEFGFGAGRVIDWVLGSADVD